MSSINFGNRPMKPVATFCRIWRRRICVNHHHDVLSILKKDGLRFSSRRILFLNLPVPPRRIAQLARTCSSGSSCKPPRRIRHHLCAAKYTTRRTWASCHYATECNRRRRKDLLAWCTENSSAKRFGRERHCQVFLVQVEICPRKYLVNKIWYLRTS